MCKIHFSEPLPRVLAHLVTPCHTAVQAKPEKRTTVKRHGLISLSDKRPQDHVWVADHAVVFSIRILGFRVVFELGIRYPERPGKPPLFLLLLLLLLLLRALRHHRRSAVGNTWAGWGSIPVVFPRSGDWFGIPKETQPTQEQVQGLRGRPGGGGASVIGADRIPAPRSETKAAEASSLAKRLFAASCAAARNCSLFKTSSRLIGRPFSSTRDWPMRIV